MSDHVRASRWLVRLELHGLVAVHAVRSVWTALAAVPGIVSADVSMTGAALEMDTQPDKAVLDAALEPAGVHIVSMNVTPQRSLPLAEPS